MKKTNIAKILSIILALVLIAVTALVLTGCGDKKNNTDETKPTVAETPEDGDTVADDIIVKGEGETEFLFYVTDANGKVTRFKILTDEETVGDALLSLGLISGDDGDYGLYVKVVNGTELDYNRDGKYWAFYVNGEYGMTGVDMTNIENGATYEFRAES